MFIVLTVKNTGNRRAILISDIRQIEELKEGANVFIEKYDQFFVDTIYDENFNEIMSLISEASGELKDDARSQNDFEWGKGLLKPSDGKEPWDEGED